MQSFFTGHLTLWHQQLLAEDPERNKSVKLPHGTLKSRTSKPSAKMSHEEDLLKHIKGAGLVEYVKTVEKPEWGEYKKTLRYIEQLDGSYIAVDETGAAVPGLPVDAGGTTFKVEVSD